LVASRPAELTTGAGYVGSRVPQLLALEGSCMDMAIAEKKYLTLKDVSDELGVSIFTVRDLVRAQLIETVRIGVSRGTVRIPRPALAAYIASRTTKAKT
jgi:excisionase family DNA binding protein